MSGVPRQVEYMRVNDWPNTEPQDGSAILHSGPEEFDELCTYVLDKGYGTFEGMLELL